MKSVLLGICLLGAVAYCLPAAQGSEAAGPQQATVVLTTRAGQAVRKVVDITTRDGEPVAINPPVSDITKLEVADPANVFCTAFSEYTVIKNLNLLNPALGPDFMFTKGDALEVGTPENVQKVQCVTVTPGESSTETKTELAKKLFPHVEAA